MDGDLVGDHDAPGFENGVEVDAEVTALDLSGRGESDTGATIRIGTEASEFQIERDCPVTPLSVSSPSSA